VAEWPGGGRFTGLSYPEVWIWLSRNGQTFTALRSTNGQDWFDLAEITLTNPFPPTVFVGLATTSANNNPGFAAGGGVWRIRTCLCHDALAAAVGAATAGDKFHRGQHGPILVGASGVWAGVGFRVGRNQWVDACYQSGGGHLWNKPGLDGQTPGCTGVLSVTEAVTGATRPEGRTVQWAESRTLRFPMAPPRLSPVSVNGFEMGYLRPLPAAVVLLSNLAFDAGALAMQADPAWPSSRLVCVAAPKPSGADRARVSAEALAPGPVQAGMVFRVAPEQKNSADRLVALFAEPTLETKPAPAEDEPGVKRSRAASCSQNWPGQGVASFVLNLFDDAVFEAVVEQIEKIGTASVLIGRLEAKPNARLILAQQGGAINGSVFIDGKPR
jgi:hypothetical protein